MSPHLRLLLMLGEEELLKAPYNVENQAHRRAVLAELDRLKLLGVKPPQNLWEYKVKALLSAREMQNIPLFVSVFCAVTLRRRMRGSLCSCSTRWSAPLVSRSSISICSTTLKPSCRSSTRAVPPSRTRSARRASSSTHRWVWKEKLQTRNLKRLVFNRLLLLAALLPFTAGAQFGTVGGVSPQVPAASVPADRGVCLGLAGRALLDLPLRHRQHRAVVRAGRLRPVEALGGSGNQVHAADWRVWNEPIGSKICVFHFV